MGWKELNEVFKKEYLANREDGGDLTTDWKPPVVSRGGVSFDWLGLRWRGEGADQAAVAVVVSAIMDAYYPTAPLKLTTTDGYEEVTL